MGNQLYLDSQEYIYRRNYITNNPDRHMESQDNTVEKFLDEYPKYWEYLKKIQPDLPEFPYGFFGELTVFLVIEYKKWNVDLVKRIFSFLEEMGNSEDKNVIDLLFAGCLECFDHQKDVLTELVELMPVDLKKLFLEHFSSYLD